MKQPKKEFHVISHTHWDREWYQPFEEFRLRLVDLMDNLLEILEQEPGYVFHLDAQTICLEDYLEIRPHRRTRLEAFIREKRLLVGPWYVQNDFYLTSGEATIRNLLIGSRIAEEFGHCSKIGYTPDQFGLIGQLPQIFNGFGIKDCLFTRGLDLFRVDKKGKRIPVAVPSEFEWRSPDGSAVLAVLMRSWYNNAQRFPEDPNQSRLFLEHIDRNLEKTSSTPFRLLMNGVDHLEAQENLLPILGKLNETLEDGEIFQSTLPEYLGKVRKYLTGSKTRSVEGELRKGPDEKILQGTLSSRPYLKTANARAQALLELQLEPLWSMLGLLSGGQIRYPQDELRHAWKMLLKNHPHDSICGCSRDEVHRDNEHRFKRVNEIGNDLLRRGLAQLAARIDRTALGDAPYFATVVNTLPFERSETVEVRIYLPCKDEIDSFRLVDEAKTEIPFEIVESRIRNRTTIAAINLPGKIACREQLIRFHASKIPACGYRIYTLEPCQGALSQAKAIKTPKTVVLENLFLKVSIKSSGRITLLDKKTGQQTRDLLSLVDEADLGNSYNFVAEKGGQPETVSDKPPAITLLQKSDLCQSVALEWAPKLPLEYNRKQMRRSGRRVSNRVRLVLSLRKESRQLDIAASVDNHSKDHRLRLLVNTDVQSDFSHAAAPFEVVKRDRRDLLKGINEDGSQPNSGMVSVRDGERTMAILNEGLYEYEHLSNARGSLAFTLVRATGKIIDGGCVAENEVAEAEEAPEWCCPENQCLRKVAFRLAVVPGERRNAALEQMRLGFLAMPLTGFGAVDPHTFSGGRPCVQESGLQELFYRDLPEREICLKPSGSALRLGGQAVFSTLKKAENGEGYIVRMYNPSPRPLKASLKTCAGKKASWLSLDETTFQGLENRTGNPFQIKIAGGKIATLRIGEEARQ